MKCMNRATLLGRVGSDPEVRSTGTGKKVAQFSLATSWGTGDKERTEWHRIVAWEKTADVIESYVKKGDPLLVEGEINYRTYEKDGETKYVTEIRAFSVILLPSGEKRQPATAGAAKKEASYEDFDADFPADASDLPF